MPTARWILPTPSGGGFALYERGESAGGRGFRGVLPLLFSVHGRTVVELRRQHCADGYRLKKMEVGYLFMRKFYPLAALRSRFLW